MFKPCRFLHIPNTCTLQMGKHSSCKHCFNLHYFTISLYRHTRICVGHLDRSNIEVSTFTHASSFITTVIKRVSHSLLRSVSRSGRWKVEDIFVRVLHFLKDGASIVGIGIEHLVRAMPLSFLSLPSRSSVLPPMIDMPGVGSTQSHFFSIGAFAPSIVLITCRVCLTRVTKVSFIVICSVFTFGRA